MYAMHGWLSVQHWKGLGSLQYREPAIEENSTNGPIHFTGVLGFGHTFHVDALNDDHSPTSVQTQLFVNTNMEMGVE
jgi:hypothetical protein